MTSNNKKFSAPLGASFIVLSSFFYASYGIWTKLMGNFFDGYTASALRSILVVLILVLISLFYKKLEPLNIKNNWKYIVGMIITSLFVWGPLYFAILEAGVGVSLTVNYASIVIGMFLFGWLLAGEHFTKNKAFAAILGITGLGLIFYPTATATGWLALGGACISGLSIAAGAVLSKKIHYASTQSTLMLWISSVIANLFMVFLLNRSIPAFSLQIEWFYLLLFAIASVVASWAFIRGLKMIDAGTAGVLGLVEIVFGVLFGVMFFSERPTLLVILGVIIVIISAALPYIENFKTKK